MDALNQIYNDTIDFEILLFPSTIFGHQEPGNGYDEITNGVIYVRPGNDATLPRATWFEKVEVNGDNEPTLYTWLKGSCGITDDTFRSHQIYYSPVKTNDIIWNFGKFLVGRDGKQYTSYHPTVTDAADLIDDIDYLLSQPKP